jgi:F-type H+-transporting ATPase subunit b
MTKLWFSLIIGITLFVYPAFGAEEGMPQLNPKFWPSQIFWLILVFASLYLIIWKLFLPKITNSIENRKSKVVNDLDEAEKLKINAEKKISEYKKIIESSKSEAIKIIESSKKKLDSDIEIKKKAFNDEIEKELALVEEEIKNLKKNSIISINKIAQEISSEVVKKIIGAEVNMSNVSAIVDDVSKKQTGKLL